MIKINFLTSPTYEGIVWFIKEVILAVVLLFLVLVIVGYDQISLQATIDKNELIIIEVEKKIREHDRLKKENSKLSSQLKGLKEKIGALRKLYIGRTDSVELLAKIQINTPKDVWYDKITVKKNFVELSGYAVTPTDIAELLTNVIQSKQETIEGSNLEDELEFALGKRHIYFDKIQLKNIKRQKKHKNKFMITMNTVIKE